MFVAYVCVQFARKKKCACGLYIHTYTQIIYVYTYMITDAPADRTLTALQVYSCTRFAKKEIVHINKIKPEKMLMN